MTKSPVVIFAYNRPDHLGNLLNSLKVELRGEARDLHVFVDGPRDSVDSLKVKEVLRTLNELKSEFPRMLIHPHSQNLGLSASIRSGLSTIFATHEIAIVLEDDLVISPGTLNFFDQALSKYRNNELVASIHGYQYIEGLTTSEAVFLRGADCWGWATWKDRWEVVNFDSYDLLQQLKAKSLVEELDFHGAANFSELLKLNYLKRIDSWAICWHVSMFLQGKLTLYPPFTLISNLGGDGTGTHPQSVVIEKQLREEISSIVLPDLVVENFEFKSKMQNYYQCSYLQRGVLAGTFHKLRLLFWGSTFSFKRN